MTTLTSPEDAALYANHRRFLETQRGALMRHDGFDAIAGDTPAFQIAMLHEARAVAEAARRRPTLFIPPWASTAAAALEVGPPDYFLTHMTLADGAPPQSDPTLHIEKALTEDELRIFTTLQTAGFEPDAEKRASLFDWFWPKNLAAYRKPDQDFLVLYRNGEPVSVLLTVSTGRTVGIYAVATPPELRKQGLSTYLLRWACAEAQRNGAEQICLQAVRGSDAERLYTKLGFRERFIVSVHPSTVFSASAP